MLARDDDALREPAPSLRELLYHAHHHHRPALAAAGTVFGLALVLAAMLPPTYRATAALAVLPSPEFTVRAAAGSHELNASALAMDQIMRAETEILSSDELHHEVIGHLGPAVLYPDIFAPAPRNLARRALHAVASIVLSPWRRRPADDAALRAEQGLARFRADLTVLPAKDANIIDVTFDGHDGAVAASSLNTLLTLYAHRRTSLYDDPQLEIVRREAEAGAHAVASADARLSSFKRDHAISDYESQRDMLLHRRSQAEQAVQDAETAANEHAARLAALTSQLRAEQPTIGLYSEKDADTRLQTANADLEAVRAKLAMASEKYRDSSRMVTSLRAELAAHEAEQGRLVRDRSLSVVREGRNPTIDPLRLDRAREVGELAATRARLAAERDAAAQLSSKVAALDQDEAALAALNRERASADDTYRSASRILAERHLSEAEETRRLANIRVIQPAAVPQTPRPIPLLVIVAGFLMACVTAAIWVVVAYLRNPVFFTADGLAAISEMPVLAVFHQHRQTVGAD